MFLKTKSDDSQKPEIQVLSYKDCLAKTIRSEIGDKPGVSVETHCLIVGYVARELIRRLPDWLKDSVFPTGSTLTASAHDVGKVSPSFQEKINRSVGKILHISDPDMDKNIGYHWTVSQATV